LAAAILDFQLKTTSGDISYNTYLCKVTRGIHVFLPVPELQLKDRPGGNFTRPVTLHGFSGFIMLRPNNIRRSAILALAPSDFCS